MIVQIRAGRTPRNSRRNGEKEADIREKNQLCFMNINKAEKMAFIFLV